MTNRLAVRFVADNDTKRAQGLMHASPLGSEEVVLFVFPRSERHAFWNKNVGFPLDLAFLDENGKVVDFRSMEAQSEMSVRPGSPARFVVEASRGTFDRLSLATGDYLVYEGSGMTVVRSNSQVSERRGHKQA
ncbi:MAG: DUF192 domain-containing protein [Armatimonadetes bacterium]|nr:DUF192 domain-containing protein [Armatimonadota bacterium]